MCELDGAALTDTTAAIVEVKHVLTSRAAQELVKKLADIK